MRGKRSVGCIIGCVAIAAGILIILGMVLPAGFWWFMLGLGLICFGSYCVRRR